jgi:hypothetical protein
MTKDQTRQQPDPEPVDPDQVPADELALLVDDDHAEDRPYAEGLPQEDGL